METVVGMIRKVGIWEKLWKDVASLYLPLFLSAT